MSVYKDMAHDAGYRGDEADQMARALEEANMNEFHRQQYPDPYPCRLCYAAIGDGEICKPCKKRLKNEQQAFDEIMENFDFEKVQRAMADTGWEWDHTGVPSVSDLKAAAKEKFEHLQGNSNTTSIYSGGLRLTRELDDNRLLFCLEFVLEEKTSYIENRGQRTDKQNLTDDDGDIMFAEPDRLSLIPGECERRDPPNDEIEQLRQAAIEAETRLIDLTEGMLALVHKSNQVKR